MKTFVLHSNQIIPGSEKIECEWLAQLGKADPGIGYIPSCSDPGRLFFREQTAYYAHYGAQMAIYFELEAAYAPERLAELLACDAIHLSGGNTFHFLHWLRQRNMLDVLRHYVADGGILIGASAGAILMTVNIGTSILCGDTPLEAVRDWNGLGLVDFAFVPHRESIPGGLMTIKNYANRQQIRLYACRDGDGLIVQDDQIRCFGEVLCIDPNKMLA